MFFRASKTLTFLGGDFLVLNVGWVHTHISDLVSDNVGLVALVQYPIILLVQLHTGVVDSVEVLVESGVILGLAELMPDGVFPTGRIILLLVNLLVSEWRYILVVLCQGLIVLNVDLLYSSIVAVIGFVLNMIIYLFLLIIILLLVAIVMLIFFSILPLFF